MVTHQTARRDTGLDAVLHAVADPNRRRILDMLAREELPVNRIADRFSMTRPAVIKHLRVLHDARLVSVRRSGRERIQGLNAEPLRRIDAWLARFDALWDTSLQRLKRKVEQAS